MKKQMTPNEKLSVSFKVLDNIYAQVEVEANNSSKIIYDELQKVKGKIDITDIVGAGYYFSEKVIKISKQHVFYCTADGKTSCKYTLPPTFFRTFARNHVQRILDRIEEKIK